MAFLGGLNYKGKSGWCSKFCPILPIERLYGQMTNALRRIYNIDDQDVIPFYFSVEKNYLLDREFHYIDVIINYCDDAPLSEIGYPYFYIDLYKLKNKLQKEYFFRHLIRKVQYTGSEYIWKSSRFDCKLFFNHIVTHLIFNIDTDYENIEHFKLIYNMKHVKINLKNMKKLCDNYIIPLTPTFQSNDIFTYAVNYSRLDTIKYMLKFKKKVSCQVNMYGVHFNVLAYNWRSTGFSYFVR